jgi:hypothetical protein
LQEKCVITRIIEAAAGVHAPGHLGELTQVVDFTLVDAVLEETGARERRLRLLPARVVVYFTLALALFEHCSYLVVWGKLTAALDGFALVRPAASSLARARRRVGAAPLRRLFEILAGPVAGPGQHGSFYRGLRTVALDGTHLHVPDDGQVTWRYPKRSGDTLEFGYPLLAVLALTAAGRPKGVRAIAALGVAAVVWGWGVAQYPVLLPGTAVTLTDAGAPPATFTALVVLFLAAVILVGPSFGLLFTLQSRRLLSASEHGTPPAAATAGHPRQPSPEERPGSATRAAVLGIIALAVVARRRRHR